MAVTNELSTQYARQYAGTPVEPEDFGTVKIAYFSFTQGAAAGDATSTATLIKLPAGQIRVLTDLCRVTTSAFGASRTLDVGYTAYTEQDGDAVTADPDYFASAVDVSSAVSFDLNESTTPAQAQLLDSRDGIVINATVAGGTIPVGATITGFIIYAKNE